MYIVQVFSQTESHRKVTRYQLFIIFRIRLVARLNAFRQLSKILLIYAHE